MLLFQPLTEMSTRNSSWEVKALGAWCWQPFHFHVPIALKCGNFNFLEFSRPVQASLRIALPLPFTLVRCVREEVTEVWRKLHTTELSWLNSSLTGPCHRPNNTIRAMTRAGSVACKRKKRSVYEIWQKNLKERNHLRTLVFDGRIILKWALRKFDHSSWIDKFGWG